METKTIKIKKQKKPSYYNKVMITKKIHVPIVKVGKDLKETLEKYISSEVEGRCIEMGYVQPRSVRVFSYSSGELKDSLAIFDVVYECMICHPVEGMEIDCVALNITETAGIRAETEEKPSPLIIYLARDHNYQIPEFSKVKVGDKIRVKVIGQRFELNDSAVSVIAELVENRPKISRRR